MSVEDVMKVNKMAQEFLDQGICASRDEAVKKAQEMCNKEIAGNDVKVEETSDRQNIAVEGDSLDKLKNIIERTKEQTERKFDAYKNALMALEKEIVSLKSQIKRLESQPKSAPQPAAQSETKEEAQQQAPEQPQQESHPKVGNHKNNEDVAIEKMFYFGNKR